MFQKTEHMPGTVKWAQIPGILKSWLRGNLILLSSMDIGINCPFSRPTTSQCAENKPLWCAQLSIGHLCHSPPGKAHGPEAEDICCKTVLAGHDRAAAHRNSQWLWLHAYDYARSNQLKTQCEKGKGSWGLTPGWGAVGNWWLLAQWGLVFFRNGFQERLYMLYWMILYPCPYRQH